MNLFKMTEQECGSKDLMEEVPALVQALHEKVSHILSNQSASLNRTKNGKFKYDSNYQAMLNVL